MQDPPTTPSSSAVGSIDHNALLFIRSVQDESILLLIFGIIALVTSWGALYCPLGCIAGILAIISGSIGIDKVTGAVVKNGTWPGHYYRLAIATAVFSGMGMIAALTIGLTYPTSGQVDLIQLADCSGSPQQCQCDGYGWQFQEGYSFWIACLISFPANTILFISSVRSCVRTRTWKKVTDVAPRGQPSAAAVAQTGTTLLFDEGLTLLICGLSFLGVGWGTLLKTNSSCYILGGILPIVLGSLVVDHVRNARDPSQWVRRVKVYSKLAVLLTGALTVVYALGAKSRMQGYPFDTNLTSPNMGSAYCYNNVCNCNEYQGWWNSISAPYDVMLASVHAAGAGMCLVMFASSVRLAMVASWFSKELARNPAVGAIACSAISPVSGSGYQQLSEHGDPPLDYGSDKRGPRVTSVACPVCEVLTSVVAGSGQTCKAGHSFHLV